jgi:hypothetical protein
MLLRIPRGHGRENHSVDALVQRLDDPRSDRSEPCNRNPQVTSRAFQYIFHWLASLFPDSCNEMHMIRAMPLRLRFIPKWV